MQSATKRPSAKPATRFVKIDAEGKALRANSASDWVAVFDYDTNLIWSSDVMPCGAVKWKDALKKAKACRLCGWKDWAAPTRVQLLTIIDDTRYNPAVNTDFFKSNSSWEWTSTKATSPAGCAWLVYLGGGNSYRYYQAGGDFFVRAVRAGQF